MPRNKSERVPGRKEIAAYGKALRETLDDPGSHNDSQLTKLWRAIPMKSRGPLISGVSCAMPRDALSLMSTSEVRDHYATYIEKHYAP